MSYDVYRSREGRERIAAWSHDLAPGTLSHEQPRHVVNAVEGDFSAGHWS